MPTDKAVDAVVQIMRQIKPPPGAPHPLAVALSEAAIAAEDFVGTKMRQLSQHDQALAILKIMKVHVEQHRLIQDQMYGEGDPPVTPEDIADNNTRDRLLGFCEMMIRRARV